MVFLVLRKAVSNHATWYVVCLLVASADLALAIPPLVSGDVPTAGKGIYELFMGYLLEEKSGLKTHTLPFWELVYGFGDRQEFTLEAPLVVRDGPADSALGFGEVVLGTKYRLLGNPRTDSGLSTSLEVKLPTGNRARGLGSGAIDVDLRARGGWEIGREVVYLNLGHTWVGEDGNERPENTWFYSGVWDHPLRPKLRLLTEVYRKTSPDPGGPTRLAATIGIKWLVWPQQQFHFSLGRSLREHTEGGPDLRLYVGWRWDF